MICLQLHQSFVRAIHLTKTDDSPVNETSLSIKWTKKYREKWKKH